MKNNIMIIVVVTLVALCVIIAVIISGAVNNSAPPDPNSSDISAQVSSADVVSAGDSEPRTSGGAASSSDQSASGIYGVGDEIVSTAQMILDREEKVPFVANGATLEGFDNSGFIYYVLTENGFITCPRTLSKQSTMGRHLEFDELKRGDLVFFCNEDDLSKAGYGGIYTGNGTMIACLMPGTYVDEIDISDSYHREYFFCGVSLS